MFREKLIPNSQGRGYLYIRDSVYVRDKRSLKKKPKKFGDGSGKLERGKYSKKKDIYCGKILEVEPINLVSFKDFLIQSGFDWVLFTNKNDFDTILDKYIEYILYVYQISAEDFLAKRKKAYTIGDGFLSPIILEWFKKFNLKKNCSDLKEYKRFFYRASDCGIFDEDLVEILYLKLIPDTYREDLTKEICELSKKALDKVKHKHLKDFIKS